MVVGEAAAVGEVSPLTSSAPLVGEGFLALLAPSLGHSVSLAAAGFYWQDPSN